MRNKASLSKGVKYGKSPFRESFKVTICDLQIVKCANCKQNRGDSRCAGDYWPRLGRNIRRGNQSFQSSSKEEHWKIPRNVSVSIEWRWNSRNWKTFKVTNCDLEQQGRPPWFKYKIPSLRLYRTGCRHAFGCASQRKGNQGQHWNHERVRADAPLPARQHHHRKPPWRRRKQV